MSGTSWRPLLPSKTNLEELLKQIEYIESITDKSITLMCKLMKMQLFNDGNKRTSMLVANHELIKSGKGLISVPQEYKVEFGTKLIAYYEDEEELQDLKEFIYLNCLEGMQTN